MKRLLLLLLVLLPVLAMYAGTFRPVAEDLFISEYVEGSSNNKALEIFNGTGATVDLSQYKMKLGSNGGAWSTTNLISLTGTLADGDVYVIANSAANATILAASDVTSTVTYFNGDDAVGLFKVVGGTDVLIDVIGLYLNDPGTAWPVAGVADATLNHTMIRKPTVTVGSLDWATASGTTAEDSEWIVQAIDYITDLGMHTFTPGGGNNTATPTYTPTAGVYTDPVNVTIACATPNATIRYTLDGTTPTATSTVYSTPINITATTTVKAMATATGFDPSSVSTATYTFPVLVSNLSALRSMPADGTTVYKVTGEVVLTFQQAFRFQKYLQDETAGILVDDMAGVITTPFNLNDGITGLTGKISEYGGMIQFVPSMNVATATSTGNVITPVPVTFDQLVSDFDDYESRVVQIMNVSFSAPTGNFANGIVYATTDGVSNYNIRTTFYDVDYINTPIPTTPKHIIGIPNSRTDGDYFTPRTLSDFIDPAGSVSIPTFNPPAGNYSAPLTVTISCATAGAAIHYTTDGSTPSDASALYTTPIAINATTTLKAIAYLTEFPPSVVNTAVYNLPVTVANIAALRTFEPGTTVYTLTGEAILTFKQAYRNQKFIQDATGAIMIDDFSNLLATAYNVGDGITGISGTIATYGGMLEFVPSAAGAAPTSTNNVITPLVVSLDTYVANFEDYESRLVCLNDVRFQTAEDTFVINTSYPVSNIAGSLSVNMRTAFYDANYIGTSISQNPGTICGIAYSTTAGSFIVPRSTSDLQLITYAAPAGLTYSVENQNQVVLNWTAGDGTVGLTGFKVYRDSSLLAAVSNPQTLTYTDAAVPLGSHSYYVTAVYYNGYGESVPSNDVTVMITANEDDLIVWTNALNGNYPNPFNPTTTISYSLKSAGNVRLDIFNVRGQLVRSLINANQASGKHSVVWNGMDESNSAVSSGVYYYRMTTKDYTKTSKMLMIK